MRLFEAQAILMTEYSCCGFLLGIILIVFPIMAAYFGSDVLVLWMFQDPFVVITMIIMGIIMIVSNESNQKSTPTTHAVVPQPLAYCSQCGAPITMSNARFCAICGRALPDYQSADMQ